MTDLMAEADYMESKQSLEFENLTWLQQLQKQKLE